MKNNISSGTKGLKIKILWNKMYFYINFEKNNDKITLREYIHCQREGKDRN